MGLLAGFDAVRRGICPAELGLSLRLVLHYSSKESEGGGIGATHVSVSCLPQYTF